MKIRFLVGALVFVCAVAVLVPLSAVGQEAAPRTPWGHPDLQGTYTSKTITPLQRPAELADRALLSAEEVASLEREVLDRNAALLQRPARRTEATESVDVGEDGAPGFYNNFWLDRGTTSTGRTSIVVDPPDGRIPPLTPEAQQDEDARLAARGMRGEADTWTDMDLNDRCMLWSVGPPMLPTGYNNNYLFLQTPEYVVIQVEMIHDARIIPLDGRPRLGRPIPQWLGEMRGHWEGDTLVVETRNIARSEEGSSFGNDVVPHPRRQRRAHGESARDRALYPGRRRHAPLTSHRRGPDALDEPVVRRAAVAAAPTIVLSTLPRGNYSIVNMPERRAAEERMGAGGEGASR